MNSYSQILRSSSIIGGANGINYVVRLVRMKIVAILLGPSGVGLVGLYSQLTSTIGTLTGLGVSSSGVRQVAEADSTGDQNRVAATVKTLRRACWLTGTAGWLLTASLAIPISRWVFEDSAHAWAISILGLTILLESISRGQKSFLQGIRRIGDLARIQVISTFFSTVAAIILYAWLLENGIVPVLISTAIIQLLISWYFARRVRPNEVCVSIGESINLAKPLVSLGLAFMWNALLAALVLLFIQSLIIRELGVDSNGLYQAAWAISGMFAGFILNAMGADFYPRLTAVVNDNSSVNRLVNEQTEIGVLLALPGLVGTLALAPWMMYLLYSSEFVPGAELLPWFVLGIFGQVISWPMGFIKHAKAAKWWMFAVTTVTNILKLVFSFWFLYVFGLVGTAIAIPLLYLFHILINRAVAFHLTRFSWTGAVLKLFLVSAVFVICAFASNQMLSEFSGIVVGVILTVFSAVFSFRGLVIRIGFDNRIMRFIQSVPGSAFLLKGTKMATD